jgi:hypothetical protein
MLVCMRTTLDITDELFRQAKKRAADEGVPLRRVVEDALRGYLSARPRTTAYRLRWRTTKGEAAPGVDLDDRKSLYDIMDGIS